MGYYLRFLAAMAFVEVVYAATQHQLIQILAEVFKNWPMP